MAQNVNANPQKFVVGDRDGTTGGAWGGGGRSPPKNPLSPPSALEFLKISVHCRHFRNLLVMFLESVVAF